MARLLVTLIVCVGLATAADLKSESGGTAKQTERELSSEEAMEAGELASEEAMAAGEPLPEVVQKAALAAKVAGGSGGDVAMAAGETAATEASAQGKTPEESAQAAWAAAEATKASHIPLPVEYTKGKASLILVSTFFGMLGVDRCFMGQIAAGVVKGLFGFGWVGMVFLSQLQDRRVWALRMGFGSIPFVLWYMLDYWGILFNCLTSKPDIDWIGYQATFDPSSIDTAKLIAIIFLFLNVLKCCCTACNPDSPCYLGTKTWSADGIRIRGLHTAADEANSSESSGGESEA